jgi:hypothetical protein
MCFQSFKKFDSHLPNFFKSINGNSEVKKKSRVGREIFLEIGINNYCGQQFGLGRQEKRTCFGTVGAF